MKRSPCTRIHLSWCGKTKKFFTERSIPFEFTDFTTRRQGDAGPDHARA